MTNALTEARRVAALAAARALWSDYQEAGGHLRAGTLTPAEAAALAMLVRAHARALWPLLVAEP
ncbi:hypothetical protein DYH09_13840 [bacterium CPR1]|nr:hypothetical protein [bacterium CPR1]